MLTKEDHLIRDLLWTNVSEQGGLEVGVGICIQVSGCCKALRVKPYPWPLIKPLLVAYDHGLSSWVIPRCSPTILILHTHRLGTLGLTEAASSSTLTEHGAAFQ